MPKESKQELMIAMVNTAIAAKSKPKNKALAGIYLTKARKAHTAIYGEKPTPKQEMAYFNIVASEHNQAAAPIQPTAPVSTKPKQKTDKPAAAAVATTTAQATASA